jgi:hypothetical protein
MLIYIFPLSTHTLLLNPSGFREVGLVSVCAWIEPEGYAEGHGKR